MADDVAVERISTLLEPGGRVDGIPMRLAENAGIAFQGCIVLGMGFILEPDEAEAWIKDDPRNAEVLFPTSTARTSTLGQTPRRRDGSSTSTIGQNEERRSYLLPYEQVAQ